MQVSRVSRYSLWLAALCLCAQEKTVPTVNPADVPRMRPRASANDYQARARAGSILIGAEFMRHAVPTPQSEFSTEDYVVVEVGLFGAPGEKAKLSTQDFSLRVNGKKAVPGQPFGVVLSNLKDPDWQPPEPPKPKGGGLSTGGEGATQAILRRRLPRCRCPWCTSCRSRSKRLPYRKATVHCRKPACCSSLTVVWATRSNRSS